MKPRSSFALAATQRRSPLRDEPFEHVTAIGQPVLQREAVDGEDGPALVENAVAIGRLEQHRVQPPREARALGERHELTLEVPSAGNQITDRDIAVYGRVDSVVIAVTLSTCGLETAAAPSTNRAWVDLRKS
ncbi:hypothetical protein [Saccharopolyspora pogona]|uniref:hypothetical protein n=1 Tax=Saccharopolyspora pogona TaxID=333966 RepID=UPI0016895575|nr:hypothetical protein [Saccharopolyspora pogona]